MELDHYLWETRHGDDDIDKISNLPESIRLDFAYHLNKDVLEKVPVLMDAEEAIIKELTLKLSPHVFVLGDTVFSEGEKGYKMYCENNEVKSRKKNTDALSHLYL